MQSLLIHNAQIVTDTEVFPGAVLVEGEHIAAVYPAAGLPAGAETITGTEAAADQTIDARGMFLLPGGVDPHTHFGLNDGARQSPQDFYNGTVAAALGGTTTVIEHLGFGPAGCALAHQPEAYGLYARPSVVDYAFHGVIQHVDDAVLADMAALRDAMGITSFKIYLTYAHMLADADVLRVLERAAVLGLTVCVHCENDAIIADRRRAQQAAGLWTPDNHPAGRPPEAEAEAVFRMLMLARAAGYPRLYIVHLSTALGLGAVRLALAAGQRNTVVETCPQYLLLDDSKYTPDAEGLKYVMAPPLRKAADQAALWQGLADGTVATVGTDHCPFGFENHKLRGAQNYRLAASGAPGVQLRLPLMFSEGYMRGRLSLSQLVRACCSGPAAAFGLAPRKGCIRPGADADLVLFDPDTHWTVTADTLREGLDYTPYEGLRLTGRPVLTLSRGEVVARDGQFVGKTGRGRYLGRGQTT